MNGEEEADDVIEEIVEAATPSSVHHDITNRHHATSSKITLDARMGTANTDDPLEKFYAKARAARESEVCYRHLILIVADASALVVSPLRKGRHGIGI